MITDVVSRAKPRGLPGLGTFLRALWAYNPKKAVLLIALQLGSALAQGAGLILLVPLLETIGVHRGGSGGASTHEVRSVLHAIGIPLDLRSILLVYVVVVAASSVLSASVGVVQTRYRWEFADSLRRRLYAAIASAEWDELVAMRQSDLLTALTVDVNWVNQGAQSAFQLTQAVALVVAQGAVALQISPPVTGLAVITGIGLAAVVWPLVGKSRRLGRDLVGQNRAVLRSVTGFLDGLKLTKIHGRESVHVASFDTAVADARRSQVDFAKANALATAVQLSATAVVLALLVGAAVGWFHLAPAGLLVLAFAFFRLVPQVTQAQTSLQSVAQALPSFDELMRAVHTCEQAREVPPGMPPGPVTAGPLARRPVVLEEAVRLEQVSFSYPEADGGRREVLRDVSLVIPARRTTALVGPSGAGKTTLADLVAGLLAPTCGRITVDGRLLDRGLARSWREVVAMVPQDPFLFHDTIRANMCWAEPDATEAEMWEALSAASAGYVADLPKGLDTVVGDHGARLSGGERQRVALARALLRSPELLVLDEATNALDASNESAVLDALAALHGTLTVIVIAHQPASTRVADQVVRLGGGRLIEVAPTAERPA